MKALFYQKLQYDFIMVRHLMYNNSVDTDEYNKVILSISESRQKIYRHSPPEKKCCYIVLISCSIL